MFEHNYAVGGAAINVEYYLAKLSNVSISNNRESALQVSFNYLYMLITKLCACIASVYVSIRVFYYLLFKVITWLLLLLLPDNNFNR